jgi:fibronectin-binding autotransporter adhesin
MAAVMAIGLLTGASRGVAITMTWTNDSDLWTSSTAWTTNLVTGYTNDITGATNVFINCVPDLSVYPGAIATNNIAPCGAGGTGGFPGLSDQARFTNNTSYTVTVNVTTNVGLITFSSTAGLVTMNAGANTLTVTNRFRVAEDGDTSTVVWAGGTLSAPGQGAGGTATLQIGTAGSNSIGTFVVANGTIVGGGSINLGTTDPGQVGRLVIGGPGIFTNVIGQAPNLGHQFRLRTAGSQLMITNGGKFFWRGGETRATSNSLILVSDPSSLLYCTNVAGATGNLSIGMNDGEGPGSLMIVSNGATLISDGSLTIGRGGGNAGQFSAFNTGIVVGAGSKLIVYDNSQPANNTKLVVGSGSVGGSHYNNLTIYDGGYLECNAPFFAIPNSNPCTNDSFNMGGTGAMSTGVAFFVSNNSGAENSSILVTNAVFTCTRVLVNGIGGNTLSVLAKGTLNITAPSPPTTNIENILSMSGSGGGTITIDAGTINAVSGTNGTSVSIGGSGNSLIITNGGNLLADALTVQTNDAISFTSGTLSVGEMGFNAGANNGLEFVVGDGTSPAYYDMTANGSGYHSFSALGSPDFVVTNGAYLRGSGTLKGTIRVYGTFVPGFANSVGSIFTSNSLTFGGSAVLNYDLGTSSDSVTVNADLKLDGTLNIADAGGFGTGDYTLFTYNGSLSASSVIPTIGSTPNGSLTYVIDTNTVGSVILHVTSGGGDAYSTWATFYGLSGGNAAGTADPDGDGMSNTNEFLAGFNPANSSARLKITNVVRTGSTDVTITYLGASGDSNGSPGPKTNVLDVTTGTPPSYTNNFVSTGQTNILSGGTGLGQVATFVHTNGATGPARYYRVRVLVP